MLSLIGREIRDHLVYVASPCVISLMVIGIAICTFVWRIEEASLAFCGALAIVLFIGFAILGAAQMYIDRSNRTSALLSTLAVTRSRILAARVIVGALTVLGSLVPALAVAVLLLKLFAPPVEFYSRMIVEVSVTLTLDGLSVLLHRIAGRVDDEQGPTGRGASVAGSVVCVAACRQGLWARSHVDPRCAHRGSPGASLEPIRLDAVVGCVL